MEKEKKYCPECGEEVIGRADKMFDKDSCRNNFNNRMKKDSTNLMRNTNNGLRKNHKILSDLIPKDRVKVDLKKLVKKGFDFDLITRVEIAKNGITYFWIYDLVYHELENDIFMIFKSEE